MLQQRLGGPKGCVQVLGQVCWLRTAVAPEFEDGELPVGLLRMLLSQPVLNNRRQLGAPHLIKQLFRRKPPFLQVLAVGSKYLGHDVLDQQPGIELAVMVVVEAPQHVHKRIAVEGVQSHSVIGAKGGVASRFVRT